MSGLRGTLTLDVVPFRSALESAQTSVRAFDSTTKVVDQRLGRFATQFSGRKVIEDAELMTRAIRDLGGAEQLTDQMRSRALSTLREYGQLMARQGREIPAEVRAISTQVEQLVAEHDALTRAAREAASAESRLATEAARAAKAAATTTAGPSLRGQLGQGVVQGLGIGAGLGVVGATAAGVGALANTAREIASEGVKLTPLIQSFERLNGGAEQAERRLEAMRTATRGLVSDSALLEASNKASLLGLREMGIDFAEVATVATSLGRAMGQDAAKSVDDLTTALSRMSPQILDNLGIKVDLTKATEAYAAANGKSAEALTEEEKKLAFATAAMEAARAKASELGEVSLTAADNIGRITTSLSGLASEAISALNESKPFVDHLQRWADLVEKLRTGGRVQFADLQQNAMDRFWKDGNIGAGVTGALMWATAGTEGRESIAAARERRARGVGVNDDLARARALSEQLDAWRVGALASGRDVVADFRTRLEAGSVAAPLATGSATRMSAVEELRAAREALAKLTEEQTRNIAAAKEAGKSNKEAAEAGKTTEAVVHLWEAARKGADEARKAVAAHNAEFNRLIGLDTLSHAEQLADSILAIGAAKIPTDNVEQLAAELMKAQRIAQQTGRAISGDVARALNTLPIVTARHPFSSLMSGFIDPAAVAGGYASNPSVRAVTSTFADEYGPLAGANTPTAGMLVGLAPRVLPSPAALDAITRAHQNLTRSSRDWARSVQDVAQAFGTLSQIAGGKLDPLSRVIGDVSGSIGAGLATARAVGLSGKAGVGLASGVAAGALGFNLGQGLGRVGGTLAGAAAGAGTGALIGSQIAPGTGTAVGAVVGAGVGAVSGYFGARAAESQLRKLKDLQANELVAQYGSLDELLTTVGRLGLSQQSFLERFYGEPRDFAKAVSELTTALTKERTEADRLAKSLSSVRDARGVLSAQQISALRATRAGSPGQDAALEFDQQQKAAGEQGLATAIAGLTAASSLSDAEVEALTRGISDSAERERIIEAALKAKAGDVLRTLGSAAAGAAAGLAVAFQSAVEDGEDALTVLARLQPQIDDLQALFDRGGESAGPGFAQIQSYASIAKDPVAGPALQVATGLGQAAAAFANRGLLSPELFKDIARGIGQAYKQMELAGKGGLDAARLLQPQLQTLWQLVQDYPGFEDQLDDDTRALLDFAQQSGLVGDRFRPAIDRMIDALNRLIARFDVFLAQLSESEGWTPPTPPDENAPGGGGGGGGGDDGGGGGDDGGGGGDSPTPGPNGGDYTQGAPSFAGGTRGLQNFGHESWVKLHGREEVLTASQSHALRTAAAMGVRFAGPDAITPAGDFLTASARGFGEITVVSPVVIDGYETARVVTKHTPDVRRAYRAVAGWR